jgi:hypothetical protein
MLTSRSVRYIYSGNLALVSEYGQDIIDLLVAADKLCLCDLVVGLQNYLLNDGTHWLGENLASVFNIVMSHERFKKLRKYCQEIIHNDPKRLFDSYDFPYLRENVLLSLLRRDDLPIEEDDIWESVLRWGRAQNGSLKADVSDWTPRDFVALRNTLFSCLPLIRFYKVS